jgi:2,4-diaminopentanoate dehydrogenase
VTDTPTFRVGLVGLGPIGLAVGKALAERGVTIAGGADPAPALTGQDLRELLSGAGPSVAIDGTAAALYKRMSAGDVIVLCTGSRLSSVAAQIEEAIEHGLHVVSTCEELADARHSSVRAAAALDEKARARAVAVLGTGVNPGLVMDRLVLATAAACVRVDQVRVLRVVDAARRRGPLRAKVGAGLSIVEFNNGLHDQRLGHVGLGESAALVAAGLGLRDALVEENVGPVLCETDGGEVPAGHVLGVRQVATASTRDGRVLVRLELRMYVGAPDPHDRIEIDGDPPIDLRIHGGTQGDRATVGTVVNAVPFLVRATPGLHSVLTLPLFGLTPV